MKKIIRILFYALPILVMIGLIPVVQNDYILSIYFIGIIAAALYRIRSTKTDLIVLIFGFCIMIICEYIFISTGVEVFLRNSLFGIMPVWLPFLWSYGFVAIKRSVEVIDGR